MSHLLPERLTQLNIKLMNESINTLELEEYKSLLELANAVMKSYKMQNTNLDKLKDE